MTTRTTLITYRRADGEPILDEYEFVTATVTEDRPAEVALREWLDSNDEGSGYEAADFVEEHWVLDSARVVNVEAP